MIMILRRQFRRIAPFLALLLSALFATPALAEPAYVLVKLPAGAQAPENLMQQLSAWRQSGQVADILVLNKQQRDGAAFEKFITLEFPSEGSYGAWVREEQPKLASPLEVVRVDVLTHGEKTPRDSNLSVFKVSDYQPTVGVEESRKYAQGYIKPLVEGQLAERLLMRYTMYMERAPGGKSWLLAEYRDQQNLDRSVPFKAGLRTRLLAQNPAYANYEKVKETLRKAGGDTFATYSELPPPQLPNFPGYRPEYKVVGGLRIVGSELKNAVNQLAEGFLSFHPEVKVSTSHVPSSEGGIAGLYFGLSDVAPMGDDAKITDVMPFFNTFGYMPTEISVATGGYEKRGSLFAWAIVANRDNPIDAISVDQLSRVISAERTGGWELINNDYKYSAKHALAKDQLIRTWGQLGVKGAWADKEIQTYGYTAPGFAIAIERHLMAWSHKYNPNFKEYVEAKQAAPGSEGQIASTVALEELSSNKYGLGIMPLMHAKNYPNVKVLKVIPPGGGAAVPLTPDTVANRTYPLIRDAYFYLNRAPGQKLDPKVREFMRFVLSREGQEIIARVGYYYPLTPEYLAEQLKKLD